MKPCSVFIMAILLFLTVAPAQAQTEATSEPDERILAISTVIPLEPPPDEGEFIRRAIISLADTAAAGVRGNVITNPWSRLEPQPGVFALDDMAGDSNFRVEFYDQVLMLGVQLINTTDKETPPDLMDVPFDDPQMFTRFQALVDAIAARLEAEDVMGNIRYFSIGNEVDVYLGTTGEWDEYATFYQQAADYVRATFPGVQVGVTATFGGTQQNPNQVARLNETSDVVIFTYYPLNPDFTPRDPDTVAPDFAEMLDYAGEKPLILQEVGYPAAEGLNSSDADQAAFVREVFAAWDAAGSRIPFLSYFALGDLSPQLCDDLVQYYGLPNVQTFYDYLCSLGLRQVDGTPRAAWDVFAEEGRRRFGDGT